MYTSFYNLKIKPFQISSDPEFLWLGEKHQEALATLKYGILDNKGFLLLTGDVGTGKTTLINSLIQSLSNDIICASVSDPSLSKLDFFNYIAASFGINQEFLSKGAFLVRFQKFLLHAHEIDKKVLLIIDEAQLLTQELLEEIRLLSNIEKTNTKLINIFFVGQNEFNEILNQDQNRAVRQRLTLNYNIDPLTPDETDEYIQYRLKVAGSVQSIFEPSAVQEIFMYSGGFPRRINIICDHALLSGYVKDKKTISAAIVQECAKELKIPAYIRNRDINGFTNYPQKSVPTIQPQSVLLKPIPPPRKKRKIGNVIIGIIGISLFLIVCWWMLFPVNFHQVISDINSHINLIKTDKSNSFSESSNPTLLADSIENKTNEYNQIEELKDTDTKEENILTKKNSSDIVNQQEGMTTSGTTLEAVQEDKKKNRIPEPLVQDELHEIKKTSDDVIKAPNTSITPMESKKDKKVLPLPEETILIRFNYNTNDFTEEGYNKLKDFADILTMHPDTKILITGYTDSEGNQKYNIKLSEFRANIVSSFLLGKGVNPNQIEVKGLGSINPIESNNTAWGRTMNRRVEIQIVKP